MKPFLPSFPVSPIVRVLAILGFFIGCLAGPGARGQGLCGTPGLTPAQLEESKAAMVRIKAQMADKAANDLTWVPLRIHVVRKSNGTFSWWRSITLNDINASLAYVNRKFRSANIQFFVMGSGAGAIDWIDSDELYDLPYSTENQASENQLCNTRDVSNALNIYFVKSIEDAGGYAYYPVAPTNRSTRNLISMRACSGKPLFLANTLAHELGHNFYLPHTFEQGNELVSVLDIY